MGVLLINLPSSAWYRKEFTKGSGMPPLGLLYIATVLQKNDIDVKLIDMTTTPMNKEEFTSLLAEKKPKIIGISTYCESWISLKVISAEIKRILPNAIVVAGGAFATFLKEEILNVTDVDIVSIGEGEYSFLKLSEYFIRGIGDFEDIPGIFYKNQVGKFVYDQVEVGRIKNLVELPFPNRDLVDVNAYTMPYTISTARGCPGACIFCSSRAYWGNRVYMRSAQNVFDEIMYLYKKYNTTYFQIVDDTFTASRKRAVEVCEKLSNTGIQFLWGCESRADVITPEFIKTLRRAGCNKIQFGLESANNNILKELKKHVTVEQIENAVQLAHSEGMYITLSYIVGHAFDTKETIQETLDFANRMKEMYGASVLGSINTPFMGTEQYERRKELGIEIHNTDWDEFRLDNPNINTRNLSIDDLRHYNMIITEMARG